MRVAQIATLVSPDGAYGGPLRVAQNQGEALLALGHEVTLFSGYRDYETPPTQVGNIAARLHPVRSLIPKSGFAGLTAPRLLWDLVRNLKHFDVVHVHLARDLVTLPAALLALGQRKPLVVQTHGMIDRSSNPLVPALDRILTRPALRGAHRVLYLTGQERGDLTEVGRGKANLVELLNGVPAAPNRKAPTSIEVLYLARLHSRKRPTYFVRAALELTRKYPDVRFTLVGPDEGEGAEVSRLIEGSPRAVHVAWEGSLPPEGTIQRMQAASIFVLPSIDEPFPMSVLEAMSVGLPVIVTDTCGLGATIKNSNAGVVVDDSYIAFRDALDRMLSDRQTMLRLGENAQALVRKDFSMETIAGQLNMIYSEAVRKRDA
jgi:glycosyltransferase involved in cell wall biosynthesis